MFSNGGPAKHKTPSGVSAEEKAILRLLQGAAKG
jgi:hypothetical protein